MNAGVDLTPAPVPGQEIPPQWQIVAANVVARLAVYGPLVALAVLHLPAAVPVLLLSAGQPWVGTYLAQAGQWLEDRYPDLMTPVNAVLARWAGQDWWKHIGILIGVLAVAIVPAPAILAVVAGHLPPIIGGIVGGIQGIWAQLLPGLLVNTLPLATQFAEGVLEKLPVLRVMSALRTAEDLIEKEVERLAAEVDPDAPPVPAPSPVQPPVQPNPPEPVLPGWLRRLDVRAAIVHWRGVFEAERLIDCEVARLRRVSHVTTTAPMVASEVVRPQRARAVAGYPVPVSSFTAPLPVLRERSPLAI